MITKQELERLYIKDEMPLSAIASIKQCSYSSVHKYMVLHDIPRRKPGFKKGTKFGIAHKQKISESKLGSKNFNFGKKRQHGKRCWYKCPNGDNVSMRSTWEVAYADYLDRNNIDWQYEPQTFLLDDGSAYTPDFFIPQENEYIEIKGWMTESHRRKIHQFQVHHKLTVLQKQELKSMGIDLLKDWSGEDHNKSQCKKCGESFYYKDRNQLFCSNICKNKFIANNRGKIWRLYNPHKRSYKGSQTGEHNNGSKLTESDVYDVITMRQGGATLKEIACKKNTSIGNVGNIVQGRSWKHIPRN